MGVAVEQMPERAVVVEGLPVHLQPQEPSMVQQEQEQES